MTERTGLETGATAAPAPAAAGTRPAFLPNEVDPTVFDEAFLRQLERLLLIMRSPVRGGLKGGRRSVKRGQSVEFADYRDYALGDDLRQLDWNVYARLEKLFVKLFVEEEDVTVTLLLDASASMASGRPEKLLFAKRAAAALGYIGLASEDRVAVSALSGRIARRRVALRGSGRVFRLLADLSAIEVARRPDRPRRRGPPRRRPAPRPGRRHPPVRPARPERRQGHPRAGRDRLRAHRPAHPVARRAGPGDGRRPAPGRRRDRRQGRHHGRPGDHRRRTRTGWPPGRRTSPTSPPSAGRATSTCPATSNLAELMFAELRRRRVLG